MAETESIETRVRKIVADQLDVEYAQTTPDASFVDDLGADSLDTVELVMAFEEEFGIEIRDEDAQSITKVGEAVSHIQQHLEEQGKA